MRDLFPGYYRPSEEKFSTLWKNCVFILDTNAILNLYRYNEQSRNDFINALRKIEERLWIPHQVALEFQENRTAVIKEQERIVDSISSILNNNKKQLREQLSKFHSVNTEVLNEEIAKSFGKFLQYVKFIKSGQLKLNQHDHIRDIVDDLFKDKIGECPTKEEMKNIENEGQERYFIKYPPGFKDQQSKKKEAPYLCNGISFKREYGDLILWKEILKEVNTRKWQYVIFITDNNKEDWWRKEEGKTIGPRPELVEEICKAGVSIFYMYTPNRFLKFATEYFNLDVKEESIQQVKEVSAINNTILYENLMIPQGHKQTERAVLRWLESEYPDDKIIQYSDPEMDLLRLTKDNLSIGYEIKSTRGSSTRSHGQTILRYVEKTIHTLGYLTTRSDLALDEFYLVVVVTNIFVHDEAFIEVLLNMSIKEFMIIQSALRSQNIQMGLIIGRLYVPYVNDEFPKIRFEKIWDSRGN